MRWKRAVTICATAAAALVVAVGPLWASGLFDITAPCPPGSISTVRRVSLVFLTPLRPCLLHTLLPGILGLNSAQAGLPSRIPAASTAHQTPPNTSGDQVTHQPIPRAPQKPAHAVSQAKPMAGPPTHAQMPISELTRTTTMAPAPGLGARSASPRSSTPQDRTSGELCPASVHDQYVTTGPDGHLYPTWHPPVDPVSGCLFGHEHGDNPSTSNANSTPPAFSFVAASMGMTEPHEGFKVFVLNAGDVSDDGRVLEADYRIVFHMGTSGVRRYVEEFHSVQYDYVARDGTGREAHIQGMADTGDTSTDGSACDLRGHKSFSTVGCDDTYEAWAGAKFQVMHPDDPFTGVTETRATLTFSPAVFDPVLTRDPSDNNRVVYTQTYRGDPFFFGRGDGTQVDPTSADAYYQGCQREVYGGPNFWHNGGRPTVYYTDGFGNVNVSGPDAMHPFAQLISATTSASGEQYKIRHDHCEDGLRPPN